MSHIRTLVKNKAGHRQISYLPPNGRFVHDEETIEVPGILETILYLGKDSSALEEYINDLDTGRIEVDSNAAGGGTSFSFRSLVGDGVSTVFVFDIGFLAADAIVLLFSTGSNGPIFFYGLERGVPTPTSIRLTLTPAPLMGALEVFAFQP
jgi:hypothetical protein